MIRHVVLFKWNDGVDAAHIAATKAGLDRLPSVIPEIVAFQHGSDLRLVPATWDYAVSADFASPADFITYREHPAHQEFLRTCLLDHGQRLAVQFNLE
jgi:hypothetical protein